MGIAANKLFKIFLPKNAGPFDRLESRPGVRRLFVCSVLAKSQPQLGVEVEIAISPNRLIYLLLPIHSPLHAAVRSHRQFLHLYLGSSVIQDRLSADSEGPHIVREKRGLLIVQQALDRIWDWDCICSPYNLPPSCAPPPHTCIFEKRLP